MHTLYLKNALVYQNGKFEQGSVLCADGSIVHAGAGVENTLSAPAFDCGGQRLVPGFLDIHTHGAAGVDVNSACAEELGEISRFFATQGTTGWLASVLTDTEEQTLRCMHSIKAAMGMDSDGAQLLGVHLEGPFLAPEYKGAMPEHLLQKGDVHLLEKYQQAAAGAVKYITVSPEVEGVSDLISHIPPNIAVAIGHSGADYETTIDCINRGAAAATHTGNAMKLLHQHHPAIFGAVLESDVYCEIICDGRHLHPAVVRLICKVKGRDRVVAVTDSIMAAGLPDGNYRLGVNDVVVEQGDAKLACSGVRAGSTLTTIQALKNLIAFTDRPLADVLPFLTANPASLIRLPKKGHIASGMDADMVLLSEELDVLATFVGARPVYQV